MSEDEIGRVVSLHRYPVKSMIGEQLESAELSEQGLLGDRAFALVDRETGRMASAKAPKLWGRLLEFQASYVRSPTLAAEPAPPVSIALPGRGDVRSDDPDVDRILSEAVGRSVTLVRSVAPGTAVEQYHPDLADLDPAGHRDEVTEFVAALFAPGTFCDLMPIHLLTTATLEDLGRRYPDGRWSRARFRPNIMVDLDSAGQDFPENGWPGRDVVIGKDVRLNVAIPVPRCVMTTLAQGDLPNDKGILQTLAGHNRLEIPGVGRYPCAGVYAGVAGGGIVRAGDRVRLPDG